MLSNKYVVITIAGVEIDLSRSTQSGKNRLLAVIRAQDEQGLRFDSALLKNLSPALAAIAPKGLSLTITEVMAARVEKENVLVAGFEIGLSLSDLPLVGNLLPADANIEMKDLKLLFSTGALNEEAMAALQHIVPPGISALPAAVSKGVNFSGVLNTGDSSYQLNTGSFQQAKDGMRAQGNEGSASSAGNSAPINKGFGPLQLSSLSLDYANGVFSLVIGAKLRMGPLTMGVQGLKIGSPLSDFKPKVSLSGLSLELQTKAVKLGGVLQRKEVDGSERYSGAISMGLESMQLDAFGSYMEKDGEPSLFVYAVLNKPLGGPTFFFVTGLAAVFGLNRKLIPPTVDQVRNYPLIKAVMDKPGPNKTSSAQLLEDMEQVMVPTPGEYFFGIGVKFNSFKVINSFGLLTARFGQKVEFDFMGLSRYVAPDPLAPNPVAVVELAVAGRFNPEEGTLLMRGQLTPESYVFSPDCHLQGGFAIACWTAGEHAGDFVYSYGGYGKYYQPPAHYPQNIPALGFNWAISHNLSAKGGGYYTITPKGVVAGAYLDACFNIGWAYVNFHMDADFQFSWKPLHYVGRFHVEFSAGVKVDFAFWSTWIRFSIGADLYVQGPPFGGSATLNLWVCDIHIGFGAPPTPKPLLKWEAFKSTFLPETAEEGLLTLRLANGLVKKIKDDNGDKIDIVNPKELKLVSESFVPSTRLISVTDKELQQTGHAFGIEPMGISMDDNASEHRVTITGEGSEQFKCKPISKRNPTAIWGIPGSDDDLVNTHVGYEIVPANSLKPGESISVDRNELAWELATKEKAFGWNTYQSFKGKYAKPNSHWVTDENKQARTELLETINYATTPDIAELSDMLSAIGIDINQGTLNH